MLYILVIFLKGIMNSFFKGKFPPLMTSHDISLLLMSEN